MLKEVRSIKQNHVPIIKAVVLPVMCNIVVHEPSQS